MTKFPVIAVVVCLVAAGGLLAACSSSSPTEPPATASPTTVSPIPTQAQSPIATASEPEASPVQTPSGIPAPEEGRASVAGTLYTFSGQAPIPGTIFYLTPPREGTDEPPRVLSSPNREEGDVQGQSDGAGRFVLTDVPPGEYYLAVWAPYDWILAVESPTDQTPRLITLEPGERRDLGRLDVAWP